MLIRFFVNRTLLRMILKKFLKVPESKVKIVESPPPARLLNNRVDKVYFNSIINKYDLPKKFIYYPAQLWYLKIILSY